MTHGSKRTGSVAGEAGDVGALANGGREGRALSGRLEHLEFKDRHLTRPQLDLLAGARPGVSGLPLDLQRRISRRHLVDRAGESRQDGTDVTKRRPEIAGGNHLALSVQRVRLLAEAD